jgi:hypothetical protein
MVSLPGRVFAEEAGGAESPQTTSRNRSAHTGARRRAVILHFQGELEAAQLPGTIFRRVEQRASMPRPRNLAALQGRMLTVVAAKPLNQ